MQDVDQDVIELVIERVREQHQFADDAVGGEKSCVALVAAFLRPGVFLGGRTRLEMAEHRVSHAADTRREACAAFVPTAAAEPLKNLQLREEPIAKRVPYGLLKSAITASE
jgi:hypothetical protein